MSNDIVVTREYQVELAEGDGRTIDLQVVPYNTVARVADPPDWQPYDEMWMPGAFDRQLTSANRVYLNFEHESGLRGIVGHGVELRETPEGLHGTFRVHDNADGDKALTLVNEGVLRGVSLEAKPIRSARSGGVVQRLRAHLDRVSLCRTPAFKDAQVLAVRAEPQTPPLPLFDPALAERVGRFVALPDGLTVQVARAFTMMAWDGSASRYEDAAAYCAACAIDDNPAGQPKTASLCHLPYKEPNGDINVNAVRNALARVDQVQTSAANRARARAMLERTLARFNSQDSPAA